MVDNIFRLVSEDAEDVPNTEFGDGEGGEDDPDAGALSGAIETVGNAALDVFEEIGGDASSSATVTVDGVRYAVTVSIEQLD